MTNLLLTGEQIHTTTNIQNIQHKEIKRFRTNTPPGRREVVLRRVPVGATAAAG